MATGAPAGLRRGVGTHLLLGTLLLLLQTPTAEALVEPQLCYVLDAVLFLYGIIITVLYCRLQYLTHRALQQEASKEIMALTLSSSSFSFPEQKEEAIYTGLDGDGQEMYETLQMKHS